MDKISNLVVDSHARLLPLNLVSVTFDNANKLCHCASKRIKVRFDASLSLSIDNVLQSSLPRWSNSAIFLLLIFDVILAIVMSLFNFRAKVKSLELS